MDINRVVIYTLSFLFYILHCCQASFLVFEKTPDVIETFFTPTLTLRCSLQIAAAPPTAVKPAASGHGGHAGGMVGRDVSKADDSDVKFVTSLAITRDGIEVANVLPYSPPTVFTDQGRLNVTGQLSHNSGEQGYLLLTWVAPDDNQAGNYTCEANGVNNKGHNLMFSRDLEVEEVTPSQANLINHVHSLESKNQALEIKVDEILRLLSLQSHVENGNVTCPGQGQSRDVTHHFRRQYATPPILQLGVIGFLTNSTVTTNQSTTEVVVGHYLQLIHVDTTSFTLRCADTRASFNFDYQTVVSWLSLPHSP